MTDWDGYLPLHQFLRGGEPKRLLTLLFPPLVEIRGFVFLDSPVVLNPMDREPIVAKYENGPTRDLEESIESFNWIEIESFYSGDLDPDDRARLAEAFRICWEFQVASQFPDKDLKVRILAEEQTGSELGVCFTQFQD